MADNQAIKHVVIIGGGSAGWLVAGRLAVDHCAAEPGGLKVTVIESPDVPTIGVGEGTWPTMRESLKRIGLSEADFIRECDVSLKQGTCFQGWRNGSDKDKYYHPFMLPIADGDLELERFVSDHSLGYGSAVSPQIAVCEQGRSPKQPSTPEYASVMNYGYHLDAGRFSEVLKSHCMSKLGVHYISDHVKSVVSGPDDYIKGLETKNNGLLEADLFVDCSGFAGLLISQHYGISLKDQSHILPNNCAMAAQIPYVTEDAPIASATLSTARDAGWIWDIGLYSRRGTGYVYASDFSSDDQAEHVLRDYLQQTANAEIAQTASVRKLSFQPGYREKFWHKNCVAVGMASGFLEPLEASALVMAELAAAQISQDLPANMALMDFAAKRYNERFTYRWERIIDFLKLHYVLSDRNDSDYWRFVKSVDSIPLRLAELLDAWQYQSPNMLDFPQIEEVFPAASYKYVLYGMGGKVPQRVTKAKTANEEAAKRAFDHVKALQQKFLGGLPENRALIKQIRTNGLPGATKRFNV